MDASVGIVGFSVLLKDTLTCGRACSSGRRLRTTHSFESGVLEQGNMENMQGGVPSGPGLRNTDLDHPKWDHDSLNDHHTVN